MAENNSLGKLDILAKGQKSLTDLSSTIEGITNEISRYTAICTSATAKISRVWPASGKLTVVLDILKRTAKDMDTPAERVEILAQRFTQQLRDMDKGVHILIEECAPMLNSPNTDPATRGMIEATFTSLRNMAALTSANSSAMQGYAGSMGQLGDLSSELRRPLSSMKKGVVLISEAKVITDSWVTLLPNT